MSGVNFNATTSQALSSGGSAWTTFSPTVTLTGGAGNTVPVYSTNTGRYARIGSTIFVEVYLTGDGGNEGAGTGLFNVALPTAANASNPTQKFPCGYALNNTAEYEIWGQIVGGASVITLQYFNAINTTVNFTGDDQNNATRTVRLKFFYEA